MKDSQYGKITVGLICLFILLQGCRREYSISKEYLVCLAQVRQISAAVVIYERENPGQSILASGIIGAQEIAGVVHKLAFPSEGSIRYLDWPDNQSFDDPWGNPYYISWSFDKVGDLESVLVWSSGPDGINHFSQSDDVFSLNGEKMPWSIEKYPPKN